MSISIVQGYRAIRGETNPALWSVIMTSGFSEYFVRKDVNPRTTPILSMFLKTLYVFQYCVDSHRRPGVAARGP